MSGVNKAVNIARTSAWPTKGGLPTIGNSGLFRGQIPALPIRHSVIDAIPPKAFTGVAIKPDSDMNIKSKTPSPQKQLTIKVGSANGKENLKVTVTPQSTR